MCASTWLWDCDVFVTFFDVYAFLLPVRCRRGCAYHPESGQGEERAQQSASQKNHGKGGDPELRSALCATESEWWVSERVRVSERRHERFVAVQSRISAHILINIDTYTCRCIEVYTLIVLSNTVLHSREEGRGEETQRVHCCSTPYSSHSVVCDVRNIVEKADESVWEYWEMWEMRDRERLKHVRHRERIVVHHAAPATQLCATHVKFKSQGKIENERGLKTEKARREMTKTNERMVLIPHRLMMLCN